MAAFVLGRRGRFCPPVLNLRTVDPPDSVIGMARDLFLGLLCNRLIGKRGPGGVVSVADTGTKTSIDIAAAMAGELTSAGYSLTLTPISKPQTKGTVFSSAVADFLRFCWSNGFEKLAGLGSPNIWKFESEAKLTGYSQYQHLAALVALYEEAVADGDHARAAIFAGDYHVVHDVLMARRPATDVEVNVHVQPGQDPIVVADEPWADRTPLRKVDGLPIVHAAVSSKLTLRSDRAQNVRTEALNIIKHRKGRVPHVVAVTAEPMPKRLASLARGTGEIDAVYHVCLPELWKAVELLTTNMQGLAGKTKRSRQEQWDDLQVLVAGGQLRDIADLPFDLLS